MRILFVHSYCGFLGSVEQNVADSAAALRERGHDCFFAHGPLKRDPDKYKAHFTTCFPCSDIDEAADGGTSLTDICTQLKPDVVYLHKTPENLPILSGDRVVRMIHDHDICCPRRDKCFSWSKKICDFPLSWHCYADAAFLRRNASGPFGVGFQWIHKKKRAMRETWNLDRLLVGSEYMRRELTVNGCDDEKIRVVPPLVQSAKPDEQAKPPVKKHRSNILFVGRLIKGKGLDMLLHALAKIKVEYKARIVGDGNERKHLEALCRRLSLTHHVEFYGRVAHADLGRFYNWSKMVAVPSRWPEPFGMVGIEAMSHARPVVAFDVGGVSDWLKHEETGYLVPPRDVNGFAMGLGRLLSNPELATRMGKAAHERAMKEYSHERLASKLEAAVQ